MDNLISIDFLNNPLLRQLGLIIIYYFIAWLISMVFRQVLRRIMRLKSLSNGDQEARRERRKTLHGLWRNAITIVLFGMASLADDLELRLNRAAEQAAPEAKELFLQAIAQMTLDDVQRIYKGPEDAATRYFQDRMTPPLGQRMAPIIDQALSEVGAIAAYDAMISQYKSYPLVPDVKADLTKYVVEEAMGGIFHYVAKEEAAIRANPAKRTTELLQRVFGQ